MNQMKIMLVSIGVGLVAYAILYLTSGRVKDGVDGIRHVYFALFSIAIAIVVGVVWSLIALFLKKG